jgi:hypothetical protein
MSPLIAMWAHPRAVSTAFLRMMIARGDVTVVHEPLVTLTDEGAVPVPDEHGGTVELRSAGEVLAHLRRLARSRPVFFKDTLEFRYQYLFDHPEEIAGIEHTFIVRDPKKAINSHYHMKPTVTRPEIGYEHQYDLFELVRAVTGKPPVVVHAEKLLREPEAVIDGYCRAVGLPFVPHALRWEPEDRSEWSRTRKWHVDAIGSSGFAPTEKQYDVTVDNDAELKSFYEYHYPFYEKLIRHAL